MSLTLGSRIGTYEVLAPLGAGGMGEVFRARDTRLERIVALKVLPRAFAADAERLARFEREARLLASLNHPNVATLYGLEDPGGAPCLVLEFVEGESLAQRLARGPVPVREALEIGAAIAAGVEAAHGRGIVHRDLKPGNVMLATGGIVKVLDFGLAKSSAATTSSVDLSVSPTVAIGATGEGAILGTAAYMSPEQARGRATDARTDVWALGCILFECLSGRAAFGGDSASDVIAQVLERDPDWTRLPVAAPPRLQALVRRCLAKDAARRPATIGEVGRELTALGAELSMHSGSGARGASTGPVAAAPSLAVLYFENLAKDAESDYFCAGITEDILTDLSKIRGLRVASRNAVARYRGTAADIAKVGAELGVSAVLEGTVRRAGERVRITAQLVSATDGFQLWAERYDRTMEDVFAVQEEIASAIAAALRVALSPGEVADLGRNRPQDVRAYDLYLKGREQYGHYTREGLEQARTLFEQAIAVDAGYALAWAGIADCWGQMMQWNFAENATAAKQAGLDAADRALELDPRLAEAWKARALVLRNAGDDAGSESAIAHALEINPRFLPALVNYGVSRFTAGDLAGCERAVRRVAEIDPQEPFAMLWIAWVCWLTGRDAEAVGLMPALRALTDDSFYVSAVHSFRAWHLVRRGEPAGALEAVRLGLADGAVRAHLLPIECFALLRLGKTEEARRLLTEAAAIPQIGAGSVQAAAEVALEAGDRALALQFVRRTIVGDLAELMVRLDPALHGLVGHDPFLPARSALVLVWPLEAPMPSPEVFALFEQVKIEPGRPQGSAPPFRG